jgi:branched-chain amino acid transport system permease protein
VQSVSIDTKNDAHGLASTMVCERKVAGAWNLLPFAIFVVVYLMLPRFAQEKQITALIYIGINVLLVVGLNLLMGYTGQVSLGHAAFFGMGAYTSAILTVRPVPQDVIPGMAVGIGVMTGLAALSSLTRASGWRLAAGTVLLFTLSWIVRFVQVPMWAAMPMYAVALGAFGASAKLGWPKCFISGVACAGATWIVHSFLERTLANNGASPWTGMLAGVLLVCVVAYIIGGQVLRLKGHHLAMATLGFGVIVEIVFRQWTAVTGGSSDGIYGIPPILAVDDLPRGLKFIGTSLSVLTGRSLSPQDQYYFLVWAFVLVALVVSINIVRSRVGRAFRAVHGSEIAAESLGVDTERYKVQVFVLSAAMASVAGSLYAHNAGIGYINPSEFSFVVSVELMVMVVVGGMASVWGSLFGAASIQVLKNWILTLEKSEVSLCGLELHGLEPIIFGAVLIVMMIVLPQGLVRGVSDAVVTGWRAIGRVMRKTE